MQAIYVMLARGPNFLIWVGFWVSGSFAMDGPSFQLLTSYVFAFLGCKTHFRVPEELVKERGGRCYLQMRASNPRICRVLQQFSGLEGEIASFAGFPALMDLKKKREQATADATQAVGEGAEPDIFDDVPAERPAKKPKMCLRKPEAVEIDVDGVAVWVLTTARTSTEDLCVHMTEDCLHAVLKALSQDVGAAPSKRAYQRSGRYAKKSEQEQRAAGDDSD